MKDHYRNRQIRRAILAIQIDAYKIERPYPKDNLITCYKDFLRVRDYLFYHSFNPRVFHSLVQLACEIWDTDQRISRVSLLKTIDSYRNCFGMERMRVLPKTTPLLFSLFKNCFEKPRFPSSGQMELGKMYINGALMGLKLTSADEQWLCDNIAKSHHILNRILRYPKKSKVLSKWAKENYENNKYRCRRAEMAALLLNDDPNFEIDEQTLIDDFEYQNLLDQKAIDDHKNELLANDIIQELTGDSPEQPGPAMDIEGMDIFLNDVTSGSQVKFSRRFYTGQYGQIEESDVPPVRDFTTMRAEFYTCLEKMQRVSMLWAIAYSCLSDSKKIELFKKYYNEDTYFTFFKVAKKCKMIDLLKWLKAVK